MFTTWKVANDAKRARDGLGPYVKKAYFVSSRVVAASVDPAVELVEFAELKLAYAAQAVRIAEYETKVKL